MAEKQKPRRYTEVVQSIESTLGYLREDVVILKTENSYTNNHLSNIDGHLEKQNTSIDKHGNRLTALETTAQKPVNLSKRQAMSLGSSLILVGGIVVGIINGIGKYYGVW